ncbi:MAG TPA: hypothetical protein VGE76_15540 [Opitutaceae bacterium]
MSDAANPMQEAVTWLTRYTCFPFYRLPAKAEAMIFVAAISSSMEIVEAQRFALQRRKPEETSAQRQHAQRRSLVHFKCDNSAKV